MVQVEVDLDYLAEAAVVAQRRGKNVQEVVNKLVEDAHTYKDLPDIGLRSCNFWCFYMGGATNLFPNLRPGENPYR